MFSLFFLWLKGELSPQNSPSCPFSSIAPPQNNPLHGGPKKILQMLLKIKLWCAIFISCKLILWRKYVIYLQWNFICSAVPLKHLCIYVPQDLEYVWKIMGSGVLKGLLKRAKWQSQSLHSCTFCPLHHAHTIFDLISYK